MLTTIAEHWFWFLITAACIVWYSTITIYVSIKGSMDIKHMLARLADKQAQSRDATKNPPNTPASLSAPEH